MVMKKSGIMLGNCDFKKNKGNINGYEKPFHEKSPSSQLHETYQDAKTTITDQSPAFHHCSICKTAFATKHKLRNHERTTHGLHQFICIFCKEGFQLKKQLITHVLIHKGAHGYKCEVCYKVRPNYVMMLRHLKTHAEKNIPCANCGACFKTKWELKSHENQHKKNRKFKCNICESTFTNSNQLRNHKNEHSVDNPCKCEICGKEFNTIGNLKNHEKLHFDEKPFKCHYCNLKFSTNSVRKKHSVIHETQGRKPFTCIECGKGYTSTTSLAVHRIKFHSENRVYQCRYCKSRFKSKASIIEHGSQHVERPHSCSQCLCRYKNKRELKRHQREKNHFDAVGEISGECSENKSVESDFDWEEDHAGVFEPEVCIYESDRKMEDYHDHENVS